MLQSFWVFQITFDNLVAKYAKYMFKIDCLVSTEIYRKQDLCHKIFLHLSRCSYDSITLIYCGSSLGISNQ